nr:myotubularin-related protein 9-like [Paramormyrops kingsleyae]
MLEIMKLMLSGRQGLTLEIMKLWKAGEGCPVLVHGSEGTDTTLLLTTLAQLILDPRCRTLPGFLALLEREWVLAGHPFQQRYAHSAYSHTRPRQEAPVFLLLLDCVWQLQRQFPLAMAFSEPLLLHLAQEVYASNFGTFLCNSDAERCCQAVKEKTHCLFQFLLRPEEREHFANPLYQPTELAIWPSVYPACIQLWHGRRQWQINKLTGPFFCPTTQNHRINYKAIKY